MTGNAAASPACVKIWSPSNPSATFSWHPWRNRSGEKTDRAVSCCLVCLSGSRVGKAEGSSVVMQKVCHARYCRFNSSQLHLKASQVEELELWIETAVKVLPDMEQSSDSILRQISHLLCENLLAGDLIWNLRHAKHVLCFCAMSLPHVLVSLLTPPDVTSATYNSARAQGGL